MLNINNLGAFTGFTCNSMLITVRKKYNTYCCMITEKKSYYSEQYKAPKVQTRSFYVVF